MESSQEACLDCSVAPATWGTKGGSQARADVEVICCISQLRIPRALPQSANALPMLAVSPSVVGRRCVVGRPFSRSRALSARVFAMAPSQSTIDGARAAIKAVIKEKHCK